MAISGMVCTALAALTTSQLASKALARGIDARLMVSLAVAWLGRRYLRGRAAAWCASTSAWVAATSEKLLADTV